MFKFRLIAGTLLAALLVAPAFAQEAVNYEDVDPTGQTVTFWHQHSRERETALEEIVAEFNANNEWGITVDAEYQGGYDDIFQKMVALLGTSDTPNIVVAYQNQAATYQLADGLLDMRPLVNSEKWGMSQADIDDFFPGFWQSDIFPSFDNARLGIAPNRSMEMLYYNQDWLDELKASGLIDFDGPPVTPAQFEAAACAANEQAFSGATAQGRPFGYELSIDASRFASWTFAFGGNIYDSVTNRYTLDSDAAIAAMTFLQGLFDKGCAVFVTEAYGDQTNFGAGRTLFTVSSSSGLPFYQSAIDAGAKFDWNVAAIPHTTADPVMNVYGASVSLPAGHSPESVVASWLFLKYYTGTQAQAEWARASQYFPVRESVAAGLTDFFESLPPYKTAFDLLEYGIAEPNVPGYDFVRALLDSEMAAIMDGADVASTLQVANKEANLILDDQLAQMD
jgi:multiple sugar transport system substrate-binding protein/sn-glycerol 3-phosphate transport system substrate-binding protein